MKKLAGLYLLLVVALVILCLQVITRYRHTPGQTRSQSPEGSPASTGENVSALAPHPIASVNPSAPLAPSMVLNQKREEAPWWTVRYGEEFWRRPEASNLHEDSIGMPASINLGDAIERVSHSIS